MVEYYLVGLAILLFIGLYLTVGYHHQKVKEKIIERAQKIVSDDELIILKRKLSEMLGREVREFCALDDTEFAEALNRVIHQ